MNLKSRHKARRYILQALYQWQMAEESALAVKLQFMQNMENDNADNDYFERVFQGAADKINEIDQQIRPALDRQLEQLTPIELSILRLATYELIACPDVPGRVIINEALELTKAFGSSDQGFKYVNGVLDKIAHQLRQSEMQQNETNRRA
ncbi:MAG: transcription antitermination factor NusB [Gammaproteobacteria bacterium]|nr:transcription antitermination factor NusB [Gammaproteobacteria bacterium]